MQLNNNHYSPNPISSNYLSGDIVYSEVGYKLRDIRKKYEVYVNTCAVRMSLALIKSEVDFIGRVRVRSGPHKGKTIKPGAKFLANQLMKQCVF